MSEAQPAAAPAQWAAAEVPLFTPSTIPLSLFTSEKDDQFPFLASCLAKLISSFSEN
jgi:hypothetical protein